MSPYKGHSEQSGRSHLSQAQNNDQISLYTATVVQVIKKHLFYKLPKVTKKRT